MWFSAFFEPFHFGAMLTFRLPICGPPKFQPFKWFDKKSNVMMSTGQNVNMSNCPTKKCGILTVDITYDVLAFWLLTFWHFDCCHFDSRHFGSWNYYVLAFWRLTFWKLSFWLSTLWLFGILTVTIVTFRHFDGRHFGSRHFDCQRCDFSAFWKSNILKVDLKTYRLPFQAEVHRRADQLAYMLSSESHPTFVQVRQTSRPSFR
jgi:hypothetical protein